MMEMLAEVCLGGELPPIGVNDDFGDNKNMLSLALSLPNTKDKESTPEDHTSDDFDDGDDSDEDVSGTNGRKASNHHLLSPSMASVSEEDSEKGTKLSSRGNWTMEEDEKLRKAVAEFGGRNWKKIAEQIVDRTDVQCLHRWQKVLRPGLIKGPWTAEVRSCPSILRR